MKKIAKKLSNFCHDKLNRSGISDIIVVKWDNKQYKCTPFSICFGSQHHKTNQKQSVTIRVNHKLIKQAKFSIDQEGNIDPVIPSQQVLNNLNLQPGKNDIQFILNQNQMTLQCQIHLFDQNDRLIISDVDGTLTKSDFYGMVNNLMNRHHIHNGYLELIEKATINGYKIVWLTMRSVSMYYLSKKYIKIHTQAPGPLFPWPEHILSALKKQLTKNTIDAKLFLLMNIRGVFPQNINPFAGALGNRQNDALAYTAAQVPLEKIFLVDTSSIVQKWGSQAKISYQHMSEQIDNFFPLLVRKEQKKQEQQLQLKKDSSIKTKDTEAQINQLKEFIKNNYINIDFDDVQEI